MTEMLLMGTEAAWQIIHCGGAPHGEGVVGDSSVLSGERSRTASHGTQELNMSERQPSDRKPDRPQTNPPVAFLLSYFLRG
jgi:hypothetical protein